MTQETQVLNHLERFGSITAWEAVQEYRIMRLASRIADLRRKGHNIVTETKTRKLPDGTKKSWAEYKMKMPSPVLHTEGRQEDEAAKPGFSSENITR